MASYTVFLFLLVAIVANCATVSTSSRIPAPTAASAKPTTRRSFLTTRKTSPTTHKTSPTTHKTSPTTHKTSPTTHKTTPTTHKTSPTTHKTSPTTHKTSPTTHKTSPTTHKTSPITHKTSPTTHKISPITHKTSPTTKRTTAMTKRTPTSSSHTTSRPTVTPSAARYYLDDQTLCFGSTFGSTRYMTSSNQRIYVSAWHPYASRKHPVSGGCVLKFVSYGSRNLNFKFSSSYTMLSQVTLNIYGGSLAYGNLLGSYGFSDTLPTYTHYSDYEVITVQLINKNFYTNYRFTLEISSTDNSPSTHSLSAGAVAGLVIGIVVVVVLVIVLVVFRMRRRWRRVY